LSTGLPDGIFGPYDVRMDDQTTREDLFQITARAFDKDNVEILISDDGCGMTPEIQRQAFDPFFTTRRDQGRVGLGLHIVYNIVTNRLGGRIDLDTNLARE